ncbi:alpha/beta hydrolase [Rhodococcus sp. NPDC003994]
MRDVFFVRGTTEPFSLDTRPTGLLSHLASMLPADRFRCRDIPYPASIAFVNPSWNPLGCSLDESLLIAVDNLAAAIRATPNRAILVGYSLGAAAISTLLEQIAEGQHRDLVIDRVILVANPRRAPGDGCPGTGYGILGAHERWPAHIPVHEIAHSKDPICNLADGDRMRTIAQHIRGFSFSTFGRWGNNLHSQLLGNRWRKVPIPERPRIAAAEAQSGITALVAYLFAGQHVGAYCSPIPGRRKTYLAAAAELIVHGREL